MTGNVLLNGKKRRLDYGGVVSIHEYICSSMDFKSKQNISRKNVLISNDTLLQLLYWS